MSEPTPTFANPPVKEFVLGVQFSPLVKLSAGHFGLFWNDLGKDWGEPEDAPPIQDQFEVFDQPLWRIRSGVQLRLIREIPPGRFIVSNQAQDRLVQIQSTRFHLNWRRAGDLKPNYKDLISEFESTFRMFEAFVERSGLGPLELNQWEVTYIDSFPRGDYWQTPADWGQFLPGLFGELSPAKTLTLEGRAAQWRL